MITIQSKSDARAFLRDMARREKAALDAIQGLDVRLGFIASYYACFRALYLHRPNKYMPKPALRRYMRYVKLAAAETTALLRENFPQERMARLKAAREAAWMAYQASDRNGPAALAA